MREPASFSNRTRMCGGSEGECRALNRSWTLVDTLLTFWPPDPLERINFRSISSLLIDKVSFIRIILVLYCRNNGTLPKSKSIGISIKIVTLCSSGDLLHRKYFMDPYGHIITFTYSVIGLQIFSVAPWSVIPPSKVRHCSVPNTDCWYISV